jgi:3-hydroxyisobutyrate dehydrogenase
MTALGLSWVAMTVHSEEGRQPGMAMTGFIGLGAMGEAMALRCVGAGLPLMVWNRTAARCAPLQAAGASVAPDLDNLFQRCSTVVLMLADAPAIRTVLGMDSGLLAQRVRGRTVVQMGTIGLDDSVRLADAIAGAGGTYLEAPVSGSRKPAESGQLVAMLAGPPGASAAIAPLLGAMCRQVIECGAVPGALAMKLAVNTALIAMVTGLVEAVHLAQCLGVPLDRLADTLLAGPMANDVFRVKLPKLVAADWGTQAAIRNVHDNCSLIVQASGASGAATPLLAACEALYASAIGRGLGDLDMVAVRQVFEAPVTR